MNGNYYNTYNQEIKTDINNILKENIAKKINVYTYIPINNDNLEKKFSGILEKIGSDYIIISAPDTGLWTLIPSIYLLYIEFEEPL